MPKDHWSYPEQSKDSSKGTPPPSKPPDAPPIATPPLIAAQAAPPRAPLPQIKQPEAVSKVSASSIKPPQKITPTHEVWRAEPAGFWKEIAGACETERPPGQANAGELIDLAECLSTAKPTEFNWLRDVVCPPRDVDLWIIGDLHGDLLALRALKEFAKRTSRVNGQEAAFIFLGDLFDDGPFGHVVLREVLASVDNRLGFFVVGNHDLALAWDAQQNQFTADVTPHDFADWLNGCPPDSPWRELAKAAIGWFANSRRVLLLSDGTLVAHGGCVHTDRLKLLSEVGGSNDANVMEDLVWLRAHDTSRRKIPNRTSRGCQFGVDDLTDFLAEISKVSGRTITRVFRGHDHVLERWAAPSRYEGRLLTLNAMSWRQRDPMGPFARQPVIARHRPGVSPELYQLEIPEEHILRLYADQTQNECGTSKK